MSFKIENDGSQIVQMGRLEINQDDFNKKVNPNDLPILPTRNLVMFPGTSIPISITREATLSLATAASEKHFPVGLVCQIDPGDDFPSVTTGLNRYGVVADVLKVIELPDGTKTALIHGRDRIRIMGKGEGKEFPGGLSAKVRVMKDTDPSDMEQFKSIMDVITETAREVMMKSHNADPSFVNGICSIPNLVERLNNIATNLQSETEEKIEALSQPTLIKRADKILKILLATKEKISVYDQIMQRAQSKMSDAQRSAFLQNQLEAIKEELYGDVDADSDCANLIKKAEEAKMPEYAREAFERELAKLQRINMNTPDYSVQYAYLETLVGLPWHPSEANPDIKSAKKELEDTHYGLDRINRRILEQLAVLMSTKSKVKTPILCLVGPPGVGKTSLGATVARAMGRKYRRVALGGVHDESEIRGHRRTYIGAMPGRIIKAVKEAGANNPVLLLDEVDKLGQDHRGDPAAALLEVLDPEQNSTFHDNYVDLDYDLSNVLFIATANDISKVDGPLRDRMEVIELSGYLPEEKLEIAKRHLIPKVLRENGVSDASSFKISDDAILALIDGYTSESGVRTLEKKLASIVRKMILAKLSDEEFPGEIKPNNLKNLIGVAKYKSDKYEPCNVPGVVTGLAWTSAGGEILLAEASLSPGKGDKISITGNLGDVMKESATIALQWVKSHHKRLGIPEEMFETHNLHIHFPEGAIPKDGPSAGITIATAVASIFTNSPVADRLAMTGEITLRGKVLPVGGIREKILAARRAGITTVILCKENKPDVEEIPENYLEGLTFHYVDTIDEVLAIALPEQNYVKG